MDAVPLSAVTEDNAMAQTISVLMIGLHPDVVDYGRWPGLTASKLRAALTADQNRLNELGYQTAICFIDRGETAAQVVTETLAARSYDCIMIGAGVRTDTEHFLLFETLINVIHRQAPQARICFNTGPTDSADAVRRWV
jgi:hypothetical protein